MSDLHALSTVLMLIAFIGICIWAFSPSRREKFKQAAQLPFCDEMENRDSDQTKDSEVQ